MITSIVILVISAALFAYWFRYTCLLILSSKTSHDYAQEVAAANGLSLLEVRDQLRDQPEPERLAALSQALDRDFRLLTYLRRHAAGLESGAAALEERMLEMDYRLMRIWYSLTRRLGASHARAALLEMADIVGHFANGIGERLAAAPAAGGR